MLLVKICEIKLYQRIIFLLIFLKDTLPSISHIYIAKSLSQTHTNNIQQPLLPTFPKFLTSLNPSLEMIINFRKQKNSNKFRGT